MSSFTLIVYIRCVSRPPDLRVSNKNLWLLNQNTCCEYSKEPSRRDSYMGESSEFPKSWTFEAPILKLAVYSLNTQNFNGQFSLNRLYINRKTYYYLPKSAFWVWLSMESQPQNPEFRNNPENLHPGSYFECPNICLNWLTRRNLRSKYSLIPTHGVVRVFLIVRSWLKVRILLQYHKSFHDWRHW